MGLTLLASVVSVAINIPVATAIGLAALAWVFIRPEVSHDMLAQKMFTGLDSFPILAIPLFMLGGEFMNQSRITKPMVDFSDVLVGSLKGGWPSSLISWLSLVALMLVTFVPFFTTWLPRKMLR
jgi:TRAP-type mannitol/chloroaromatic compound transport system permease large subunit